MWDRRRRRGVISKLVRLEILSIPVMPLFIFSPFVSSSFIYPGEKSHWDQTDTGCKAYTMCCCFFILWNILQNNFKYTTFLVFKGCMKIPGSFSAGHTGLISLQWLTGAEGLCCSWSGLSWVVVLLRFTHWILTCTIACVALAYITLNSVG